MKKLKRHSFSSFLIVLCFLFMLLSPQQVFNGAKTGLLLWYQTILPTLLPFSIISNLMIETNSFYYISSVFSPLLRPIFKVSDEGVFVIMIGFLCGYPLGAKIIGRLYQNNMISMNEADYLLSFCNNVSPIFIINYLVFFSFQNKKLLFPVLLILIGSPIICSFIYRSPVSYQRNKPTNSFVSKEDFSLKLFHVKLLNECMMDGIEMMVVLGGYIMAFSIFFTLLYRFISFPFISFILPFLEVTNGISYIQTLSLPFSYRFFFTLAITSFGGCCAIFQTMLVLSDTNLSIRKYTQKKLVTMLVTSILAYLYLLFV